MTPGEPRERRDRQAAGPRDHAAAVRRLVDAATGLAATIAVTEQLAQARADIMRPRAGRMAEPRTRREDAVVSLAEAARRTGRHPEVLRRWCSEGRIPAVRVGRTWGLTAETVAMLMAHAARSRPRLPATPIATNGRKPRP